MSITIKRWYHDDCVIGRLSLSTHDFQCFTLELPDLDNQRNISCIPEGDYRFEKYKSPKHGNVLLLKDVEDRSMIEVHGGNYTSQILGCILVGDAIKWLNRDSIPDVANSRNTLIRLLQEVGDTGTIKIRG